MMPSFAKTAAYGLFSALLLALTVPAGPDSAVPTSADAHSAPPSLSADTRTSTTGYYTLAWEPADADTRAIAGSIAGFELQERADDGDWSTRYVGPDRATTLTGMPNGTYAYRVRALTESSASAWSSETVVEVKHHDLGRAFAFLAVGAAVFLATLALIVAGHRRQA